MIDSGALTKGHGKVLLTEPDHHRRVVLARQAAERGWSVRALESEIARAAKPPAPRSSPDPDQRAVGDPARGGDHESDRMRGQGQAAPRRLPDPARPPRRRSPGSRARRRHGGAVMVRARTPVGTRSTWNRDGGCQGESRRAWGAALMAGTKRGAATSRLVPRGAATDDVERVIHHGASARPGVARARLEAHLADGFEHERPLDASVPSRRLHERGARRFPALRGLSGHRAAQRPASSAPDATHAIADAGPPGGEQRRAELADGGPTVEKTTKRAMAEGLSLGVRLVAGGAARLGTQERE